MRDAERPSVIYVTSRGHSGSTLTEMLLAGHSEITTLGELKQLGTEQEEDCRCGAGPIASCPFWQSVDAALAEAGAPKLAELSLEDEDDSVFAAHNDALFRAVRRVTGSRLLIDSSKTVRRLERLEASGRFELHVLHLVRSPYGVVYSNVKRERSWREHAQNYTVAMMKTREFLAERRSTLLRYEELVADPERQLRRLLADFGCRFEPGQLDWANQELHTFAGNPMRVTRDSTIRRDTAWRRGLGWRRILGITWWTLPTRFGSDALYRNHMPYWKGEGIEAWRAFRKKRRKRLRHERHIRMKSGGALSPLYFAVRGVYRRLRGRAADS